VTNDDIARVILADNQYVVLATADPDGTPWATPVWYATDDSHRNLYWLSSPAARHSENISVRRDIAMVVFDSTVPPETGQAVYMVATAQQIVGSTEARHSLEIFSRKSTRRGGRAFSIDNVAGESRNRLYCATVEEHFILDPDSPYDVRTSVQL
jgi:nitroimidazol reductase NimA-like FMN-containing flavoprotein (pyridoxamine 5'-phosphate oxidase superfamily)